MSTFFWIIGVFVGLAIILAFYVIGNLFFSMIFISEITQNEIKKSEEYITLVEGVIIEEINYETPLSKEDIPTYYKSTSELDMLLYEDGSIKEGRRFYDTDPGVKVIIITSYAGQEAYVFNKNEVFQFANGYIGKKIGEFSLPQFSYIDFVLPVNDKLMLVHGRMEDFSSVLWQVDFDSLNKTEMSHDPYYIDFPPKLFLFEHSNEKIIVYYVENFSFAFGGDSSRPKYSVVRIYNSFYPEGRDIIKFGFKAGTIIDVSKSDKGYLFTTDPSLPAMANEPRVNLRKWEIIFKD